MLPPRKRPLYHNNLELLYVENYPREESKKIRLEGMVNTTVGEQNYTVKGKVQQQPCPRCLAGESGHFKHV